MQEIHQVLRRKRAQYAQLAKEIELLQQAEEKLREVAPLLADAEDEDSAVLVEVDEDAGDIHGRAAKAASASGGSQIAGETATPGARPPALRWP
jgi:hypothetical protein